MEYVYSYLTKIIPPNTIIDYSVADSDNISEFKIETNIEKYRDFIRFYHDLIAHNLFLIYDGPIYTKEEYKPEQTKRYLGKPMRNGEPPLSYKVDPKLLDTEEQNITFFIKKKDREYKYLYRTPCFFTNCSIKGTSYLYLNRFSKH